MEKLVKGYKQVFLDKQMNEKYIFKFYILNGTDQAIQLERL